MIGNMKCLECKGNVDHVVPSAVPGMAICQSCGKPFPMPADVIEHLYGAEETDAEPLPGEAIEIPDSIECAIGWRTWGIKVDRELGAVPLMYSATHQEAFWTPGLPMVALCERTGNANGVKRKGHEVPNEQCSCGLYSAKTYEHLMSMTYHRYNAEQSGMYSVVGKVKLWGKVIEGNQGWRAAIGYPEELYVPYEAWALMEPLREAYGVEVGLKNILGEKFEKQKKED